MQSAKTVCANYFFFKAISSRQFLLYLYNAIPLSPNLVQFFICMTWDNPHSPNLSHLVQFSGFRLPTLGCTWAVIALHRLPLCLLVFVIVCVFVLVFVSSPPSLSLPTVRGREGAPEEENNYLGHTHISVHTPKYTWIHLTICCTPPPWSSSSASWSMKKDNEGFGRHMFHNLRDAALDEQFQATTIIIIIIIIITIGTIVIIIIVHVNLNDNAFSW